MTDTEFEAVKAFLTAYRYTEPDICVRLKELNRLQLLRETLSVQKETDLLFHLDRAICGMQDTLRMLSALQAEVECAVAAVENVTLREILIQHYICGMDLKQVAKGLNYSDRHLRRLHKRAIESIPLSAIPIFKTRGKAPRATPFSTVQRI